MFARRGCSDVPGGTAPGTVGRVRMELAFKSPEVSEGRERETTPIVISALGQHEGLGPINGTA